MITIADRMQAVRLAGKDWEFDDNLASRARLRKALAELRNADDLDEHPVLSSDLVNALPEDVRRYIAWIETSADPAGTIQENYRLMTENKALCRKLDAEECESCGAKMVLRCSDCGRRLR